MELLLGHVLEWPFTGETSSSCWPDGSACVGDRDVEAAQNVDRGGDEGGLGRRPCDLAYQ